MNDLHDQYLQDGEQVYVGKPDSVRVYPGKERALVRYWTSDPKATKIVIYWNSRQDSLLIDIPDKQREEPVDVMITGLAEQNHTFELVTMNAQMGNRSIPLQATERVYSVNFQESLQNRRIRSAVRAGDPKTAEFVGNALTINWLGEVEHSIKVNLRYTNSANEEVSVLVSPSESQTLITDYKENLSYRTFFKPDTAAIDTFYTEIVNAGGQVEIPIAKPYADFSRPGIIPTAFNAKSLIWNKVAGDANQSFLFYIERSDVGTNKNRSVVFDLQVTKKLTRFRQWQRLGNGVEYILQNARHFEIWGTNDATVNAAGDASFNGWTKLGSYEVIKPSSPASYPAAAAAGDEFVIDPAAPPVRYIRYVVLSTWDFPDPANQPSAGTQHIGAIGELTFYGFEN